MPLPRIQVLLFLLSIFTLLVLICYLFFTTLAPVASHGQATSSFLFPASAVISLTNDNSTFFISRPAAFGPLLPKSGMEGELFVLEEGQLACDDTLGWDPSALLNIDVSAFREGEEDDGTDNILNPSEASTEAKASSDHADIQSLQQSAEIEGKIVLVSRGGCGFLEKVLWTQRRGGVALIVGDYHRPGIGGSSALVTMYAKGDTSNVSIPSLFTSHTTAALLTTLLPKAPLHQPALSSQIHKMAKLPPSSSDRSRSSQLLGGQGLPPLSTKLQGNALHTDRTGLWITLTPTTMTSSPFFDTLLVLVVSPLVTLTAVYGLLLIRSRIRRHRWRAPKSLVDSLPVRTYQSTSSAPRSPIFPSTRSSLSESSSQHTDGPRNILESSDSHSFLTRSPLRRNTTPSGIPSFARRGWSGNNECVVCLEEYIDGVSRVMRLPCGHEFHVGCITPWLTTRRRTCPICKGDVVRGAKASSYEGANETTPLVVTVNINDDNQRRWEGLPHSERINSRRETFSLF